MNNFNIDLMNPTNFQPENLNFTQIVRQIYDLAYTLLGQAVGEENIPNLLETEAYSLDHRMQEIASRLGIIVTEEMDYEIPEHNIAEVNELRALNNRPDIPFTHGREINRIAFIKLYIPKLDSNMAWSIVTLPSCSSRVRTYLIARAIASLYFVDKKYIAHHSSTHWFLYDEWTHETEIEFIGEIFACALIAPDPIMQKLRKEYRNMRSFSYDGFLSFLSDKLLVSFLRAHMIYHYWKQYNLSKYLEECK